MKPLALLLCPLLLACAAVTTTANDDAPDTPEEEALPTITRVEPGTDIDEIHCDDFELGDVEIEDDVLKIEVSYSGGAEEHEFGLYWNGVMLRSYPGQIHVHLKHDANGDAAEAYLTETIEFDLTTLNQPVISHIHGPGEDNSATVQYGER